MATAMQAPSELTAAIVNPLLAATKEVFETMLGCTPTRDGFSPKNATIAQHQLSAAIGLTGEATGTFVLSLPESTAIAFYNRLLGLRATRLDAEVRDAVGEVANMIIGRAKVELTTLKLSISSPNLVSGVGHQVHYPVGVQPFCLVFRSEIGDFTLEVGFADGLNKTLATSTRNIISSRK